MIPTVYDYNTKSRFSNISRTSWNWDFTKSMSSGEEEREEVIGVSGSDHGSVGDDSLACMTMQLLVELRNEDQAYFKNFMRMPPELFDELLTRVGPRITKQNTNYREALDPLSETCPHCASSHLWDQLSHNVLWVEGASQYHIPPHPKGVPGHHR